MNTDILHVKAGTTEKLGCNTAICECAGVFDGSTLKRTQCENTIACTKQNHGNTCLPDTQCSSCLCTLQYEHSMDNECSEDAFGDIECNDNADSKCVLVVTNAHIIMYSSAYVILYSYMYSYTSFVFFIFIFWLIFLLLYVCVNNILLVEDAQADYRAMQDIHSMNLPRDPFLGTNPYLRQYQNNSEDANIYT